MRRVMIVAAAACAVMCLVGMARGETKATPGERASDISPSVQFSADGRQRFTLADFRGKVVVVLFFQTWCPICNGWSPRLIGQLEEAATGKPDVVLLAVRCDGDYAGATKYMQDKIKNPSRWIVAADREATWYQVALGTDELWSYMVIGPDGKVVRAGEAGMYYTSGPAKDKFSLPSDLDKYIADAQPTTVLPKDKTYHDSLKAAVLAAEMRQFAIALKLCAKPSRDASASAAELKKDLSDWAAERVKALAAVVADEQASSEAKFDAWAELKQIADGLGSTEPGKAAKKAAADAAKDKGVAKEIQAETDYLALVGKAAAVKKLVGNADFAGALKALAKKHPDTRYGKMAEADAARIGG